MALTPAGSGGVGMDGAASLDLVLAVRPAAELLALGLDLDVLVAGQLERVLDRLLARHCPIAADVRHVLVEVDGHGRNALHALDRTRHARSRFLALRALDGEREVDFIGRRAGAVDRDRVLAVRALAERAGHRSLGVLRTLHAAMIAARGR